AAAVIPGWSRGDLPTDALGRFSDVAQEVVDSWRLTSAGCGDDHDPAERLDDLVDPRPGRGGSGGGAGCCGRGGRGSEHPELPRLRFSGGQVAVEGASARTNSR